MNAFEAAAAPFGGCVLPVTDAVHGDWCVGNILAHEGRITGIVDSTAAGYGTRAIDLASLLHYAYAEDYENVPGLAVRRRLWREVLALGGKPMLVVLLIYRAMALVEFAARHHGEEGVAAFTAVGWKVLRDLSAGP
jgi:aminoglycoside phosphotransferase (APT) family kinase protein